MIDGVIFAESKPEWQDFHSKRSQRPRQKRPTGNPKRPWEYRYKPIEAPATSGDLDRLLSSTDFTDPASRNVLADALLDVGRDDEAGVVRRSSAPIIMRGRVMGDRGDVFYSYLRDAMAQRLRASGDVKTARRLVQSPNLIYQDGPPRFTRCNDSRFLAEAARLGHIRCQVVSESAISPLCAHSERLSATFMIGPGDLVQPAKYVLGWKEFENRQSPFSKEWHSLLNNHDRHGHSGEPFVVRHGPGEVNLPYLVISPGDGVGARPHLYLHDLNHNEFETVYLAYRERPHLYLHDLNHNEFETVYLAYREALEQAYRRWRPSDCPPEEIAHAIQGQLREQPEHVRRHVQLERFLGSDYSGQDVYAQARVAYDRGDHAGRPYWALESGDDLFTTQEEVLEAARTLARDRLAQSVAEQHQRVVFSPASTAWRASLRAQDTAHLRPTTPEDLASAAKELSDRADSQTDSGHSTTYRGRGWTVVLHRTTT